MDLHISFCFDFKGESGGSPIQIVYLVVAVASALVLLCTVKGGIVPKSRLRGILFVNKYWWTFLASTVLTFFYYTFSGTSTIDTGYYLRDVVPYLLCGLSLTLCLIIQSKNVNPAELVRPMLICAILDTIWHYYYGASGSVDISEMRYQITSPTIQFLFAYGLVGCILSKRITVSSLIALVTSFAIAALSITRFYVIMAALCIPFVLLLAVIGQNQSKQTWLIILRRVLFLAFILIIAMAVVIVIRPNTLDQWTNRMTDNYVGVKSADYTYLIRESEQSWDLKELKKDYVSLAIGKGLGAPFLHDQNYRHLIKIERLSHDASYVQADCMWSYALFTSGFVFGTMMLAIFVFPTISFVKRVLLKEVISSDLYQFKQVAAICLIADFSQIFTGAPFGDRIYGVFMGFTVGLLYWQGMGSSKTKKLSLL